MWKKKENQQSHRQSPRGPYLLMNSELILHFLMVRGRKSKHRSHDVCKLRKIPILQKPGHHHCFTYHLQLLSQTRTKTGQPRTPTTCTSRPCAEHTPTPTVCQVSHTSPCLGASPALKRRLRPSWPGLRPEGLCVHQQHRGADAAAPWTTPGISKLHSRSTRSAALPKCEFPGLPRPVESEAPGRV